MITSRQKLNWSAAIFAAMIALVAANTALATDLYVKIEANITAGRRPMVVGTTNLPDGTHMWVRFNSPTVPNAARYASLGLSICGDKGCSTYGPVMETTLVKHGAFTYGPITDKGGDLKPGPYELDIMVDAFSGMEGIDGNGQPFTGYLAAQPPEVVRILGKKGVNMVGPLVGACCFQLPEPYLSQQIEESRKRWRTTGAWVYFAREVEVH